MIKKLTIAVLTIAVVVLLFAFSVFYGAAKTGTPDNDASSSESILDNYRYFAESYGPDASYTPGVTSGGTAIGGSSMVAGIDWGKKEPAEFGSDRWFLEEFIDDLEALWDFEVFSAGSKSHEYDLLIFAYIKLYKQERLYHYQYFDGIRDRYILPYELVNGIIRQHFGDIDLRGLDSFDEQSQGFILDAQTYGPILEQRIVNRKESGGKITLTVDIINSYSEVVRTREYVFSKTQDGYILLSSKVTFRI